MLTVPLEPQSSTDVAVVPQRLDATGYLAADGFLSELEGDLATAGVAILERHGRLLVASGPAVAAPWAQVVWPELRSIAVPSIGRAADALRRLGRNWALWPSGNHRRAALIEARLPHVSAKPLVFPARPPTAPLGGWTLVAADRILGAPTTSSPVPHGQMRFVEDRLGPPNRAYLKLWEVLTLVGRWPGPGDRCFDLGAAPGGWTWVVAQLGAQVTAIDKAPLDPAIAARPTVQQRLESAFALDPAVVVAQEGPIDWLFCDVICYPARLLGLIERWLAAGAARHIVCTVKFQGGVDPAIVAAFAAIPGGQLRHLFHNKHELTWAWGFDPRPSGGDGR